MTHVKFGNRGVLAGYSITIFISSALLLVLEIVAGRLIAPYVGVSLYTWTAIIGVILAGLSLGNWIGGVWADRGGGPQAAGLVLAMSSIASLAILLLLNLMAPLIQSFDVSILGTSFIYVSVLFFMPAMFLGVITPLLTTLALKLDERAGHVVGRMHALAALGSIFGTFITGYWLIQYFGTRQVIIGTAALLLILSIPFLRNRWRTLAGALIVTVILVSLTYIRNGFANPCDAESNYYCIRIVNRSSQAPFGTARGLVLDHLLHSSNHETEPRLLLAPYVHLMDELVRNHYPSNQRKTLHYFFAGGGAYTQPRAIRAFTPKASITIAELDPIVTRIAKERLYLVSDGMRIYHADTRVVLKKLKEKKFNVIVTDVFHDIAIPYHLTTHEYASLIKSRLTDDGLYVLNVVDIFPDGRLVKSMVKTLKKSFRHVHIWLAYIPIKSERMTYVISASNHKVPPEKITAKWGIRRQWFRVTGLVMTNGTHVSQLPVLRDNFVPVERLIGKLYFSKHGK